MGEREKEKLQKLVLAGDVGEAISYLEELEPQNEGMCPNLSPNCVV